jgi:hypothetical protein
MQTTNEIEVARVVSHFGHKIEIAFYGEKENVAIECADCYEVIWDYDLPKEMRTDKVAL